MMRCSICGVESDDEDAFIKKGRSKKAKIYCPLCWKKDLLMNCKNLEILTFLILILLIFGIIAELIDPSDSNVIGSSITFILFLVFLFFSGLSHEFAHAFMGKMLGERVFKIIIGIGKTLYKTSLFGIELVIKRPLFGFTLLAAPKSTKCFKLKYFLIVLAGPLTNFLLVLLSLFILEEKRIFNSMLISFSEIGFYPFHVLIFSNLILLIANLIPRKVNVYYLGEAETDGLNLFRIPSWSRGEVEEAFVSYFLLEGWESLNAKDYKKAKEWYEKGLKKYPDNVFLKNGYGVALLKLRQFAKARDVFFEALKKAESESRINSRIKPLLLANIAYTFLLMGGERHLSQANKYSETAFKSTPWENHIKAVRGFVLIEMGDINFGLKLINEAWEEVYVTELEVSPSKEAAFACFLSIGEKKRGNLEEAYRYYQKALKLDSECIFLKRVKKELESKVSTQLSDKEKLTLSFSAEAGSDKQRERKTLPPPPLNSLTQESKTGEKSNALMWGCIGFTCGVILTFFILGLLILVVFILTLE